MYRTQEYTVKYTVNWIRIQRQIWPGYDLIHEIYIWTHFILEDFLDLPHTGIYSATNSKLEKLDLEANLALILIRFSI